MTGRTMTMKKTYVTPDIRFNELDFEGFICASIKTMSFTLEVDQHDILNEEDLYL